MKKIYSIVLMATALLIGTNAWASHDRAWLQAQFDAVQPGQTATITLDDDVNLIDGPVWLGTANLDDPAKSITLDLNGHTIAMTANGNAAYYMFVITRGELIIDNGTVTLTGNTFNGTSFNEGSQIFSVFGSYKSSYWTEDGASENANPTNTMDKGYFTHLEIGENLNIIGGENVLGAAIVIDQLTKGSGPISGSINTAINYQTNIRSDGFGFAYGARVDVKGSITMLGKSGNYVKYETVNGVANTPVTYGYKCYGIKTNGMLASPLNVAKGEIKAKSSLGFTTNDSYFDATYNVEEHKNDTIDAPFVYVHKNARIITNNGSIRSTAIYSSGYAKYLIKGTCEGNVGVNIKSGKVILDDATIASTATTYTQATGQGGASGSGSAVVLNSTSYEGGMQVTISGDTKITADAGYAIEEVVNTQTTKEMANPDYVDETTTPDVSPTVEVKETKVLDIIFNGGTIEGGNKGAVVVSYDTEVADKDKEEETTITVYGATVTGETKVGTDGDLTDLLPTDESENPTAHITVVTDPETGKQTLVVSKGQEPITSNKVSDQTEDASVKWEGPDYVNDEIAANTSLKLKELVINDTITKAEAIADHSLTAGALRQQTLTLRAGSSLTVDRVVLGSKAKIIVEPGAKFIVKGEQGIVAPVADNIVLKASQDAQATFLFNPAVTSNRHPNATVEFTSKSYRKSSSDFAWQRFGIPTFGALSEITAKTATAPYSEVPTAFALFNYENNIWERFGYIHTPERTMDYNKMSNPFDYYNMLNNTPDMGTIVTMKGELYGNESPTLSIRGNFWNGFANSYMAPINGKELLSLIPSTVSKTFYLNKITGDQATWEPVNTMNIVMGIMQDILPMQPFLIENSLDAANTIVNYEKAVYNPAMGIANNAPARYKDMPFDAAAKISVQGVEGTDRILVAEGELFSVEFDNGYDATKYMNERLNLYVTADKKMANFATDNLEDTYIGFQSVKGGEYTIDFTNVQGDGMTLVDLETGARTLMVEGNTYTFNADANTTNDYRFKIVNTANAMTAIENTEAVKSAKGVYTITGMYVGEMNVWNTLPAGVYVVNGEKRVK